MRVVQVFVSGVLCPSRHEAMCGEVWREEREGCRCICCVYFLNSSEVSEHGKQFVEFPRDATTSAWRRSLGGHWEWLSSTLCCHVPSDCYEETDVLFCVCVYSNEGRGVMSSKNKPDARYSFCWHYAVHVPRKMLRAPLCLVDTGVCLFLVCLTPCLFSDHFHRGYLVHQQRRSELVA